jgi:hypothetical protein
MALPAINCALGKIQWNEAECFVTSTIHPSVRGDASRLLGKIK